MRVTPEEELFVHFLILDLRASFKARKLGLQFDDDNVRADVRYFLSRPIIVNRFRSNDSRNIRLSWASKVHAPIMA